MNVGLTFDLYKEYLEQGYGEIETAEFDSEDTIEGIEAELHRLGHRTERIGNAKSLMHALSAGRRWDLVFNICEGMHGTGREALVPALLDCYLIPYTFSDPLALAVTLHKGVAKRVMRDLGIPTPPFVVVETPDDIGRVTLPFPLFAKPVMEGSSKGIDKYSRVGTPAELDRTCRRLLHDFGQAVLVERYLPGREFTLGFAGTGAEARCIGGMEIVLKDGAEPGVYSYNNKQKWETLVEYRRMPADLFESCRSIASTAWLGLGCRDAGRVDVRLDENGAVNILEINPLAGLNPISDLSILCRLSGVSYEKMIALIMESALKRVPNAAGAAFPRGAVG